MWKADLLIATTAIMFIALFSKIESTMPRYANNARTQIATISEVLNNEKYWEHVGRWLTVWQAMDQLYVNHYGVIKHESLSARKAELDAFNIGPEKFKDGISYLDEIDRRLTRFGTSDIPHEGAGQNINLALEAIYDSVENFSIGKTLSKVLRKSIGAFYDTSKSRFEFKKSILDKDLNEISGEKYSVEKSLRDAIESAVAQSVDRVVSAYKQTGDHKILLEIDRLANAIPIYSERNTGDFVVAFGGAQFAKCINDLTEKKAIFPENLDHWCGKQYQYLMSHEITDRYSLEFSHWLHHRREVGVIRADLLSLLETLEILQISCDIAEKRFQQKRSLQTLNDHDHVSLDGLAGIIAHREARNHDIAIGSVFKIDSSTLRSELEVFSLTLLREEKLDPRCADEVRTLQGKIDRIRDTCLSNQKKGIRTFFAAFDDHCVSGLIDELHACAETQVELGQRYRDREIIPSIEPNMNLESRTVLDLPAPLSNNNKAAPFFRRIEEVKGLNGNVLDMINVRTPLNLGDN